MTAAVVEAPGVLRDADGKPTALVTPELHAGDPRLYVPPTEVQQRFTLQGRQLPRYAVIPEWTYTAGDDVADLMSVAGMPLLSWQHLVMRNSLPERPDGRWGAFEVVLVVPRQNGKNITLLARQMAGLFLFKEKQIFTAHVFKTAVEAHRDLATLIEKTPELRDQVKITRSAQNVSVYRIDDPDVRVDFVARGASSGRGLSADVVYLDEAFQVDPNLVADLLPVLSARRAPQIWYTSSAGMQSSEVLETLKTRAHDNPADEPALAYFEWAVEPEVDECAWDSAEAVQISNPSLGYFQDWEWIKAVDLRGMDQERSKRERLGIWADKSKGAVIGADVWRRALVTADDLAGLAVVRRAISVEVTRDRDLSCVVGAAELEDGRVLVEVIEQRAGTAWVAAACRSVYAKAAKGELRTGVVIDSMSAGSALAPHLIAEGVPVSMALTRDLVEGTADVYDRLHRRTSTGIPDPYLLHTGASGFLDDAVITARRRLVGQSRTAWTWDEGPGALTLAPLRAATLAVRGLTMEPVEMKRKKRRVA